MQEQKRQLVEFLTVAAIVVVAITALVVLAVAGVRDEGLSGLLQHLVSAGFGALIALAYAARGIVQKDK